MPKTFYFCNSSLHIFHIINLESSEDISPYATFQLAESNAMIQSHPGGANTLLHSFMYHERAMTEGCASPNPAPMMRKMQSPYYNIVSHLRLLKQIPIFSFEHLS